MKNRDVRCFIDFDGTIVDNTDRIYNFYIDHIPVEYRDIVPVEEFWQNKKQRINEIEWLNSISDANLSVKEYNAQKIREIETDKYLAYDKVFPFT